MLLLGGVQEGLLRRYVLGRGEESELGRQESLPMPGGPKALWTGIQLAGRPALVAVDSGQPRLRVQPIGDAGWQAEETFPLISGVRGLAAAQAQPGKLLLWTKDATDLYTSVWENNRMTYPVAMPQSADVADRTILALATVGRPGVVGATRRADLDLYVWEKEQAEPARTRFTGQGTKAEKVVWLGGKRVLVQPAYSNALKLVSARRRRQGHLARAGESGESRSGRIRHLQLRRPTAAGPIDRWRAAMARTKTCSPPIRSCCPTARRSPALCPLPDGTAWALEQGGAFVHLLKPDDAGILRVKDSIKPPGGSQLLLDPVLG